MNTQTNWRRGIVLSILLGGLGGVAAGGCSSSTPTSIALPSSDPVATPNAAPSASVRTVASAQPGRAGATTPGVIRCDKTECNVGTEICCMPNEGSGVCKPIGSTCDGTVRECDESADCPSNERCHGTPTFADECPLRWRWACGPKNAPNGALVTGEVCVAGGQCSTGPCKVDSDSAEHLGECPEETPAVACGAAKCKSGEACCWDGKAGTGKCIAIGGECSSASITPDSRNQTYTCETKNDCEPDFACYSNSGNPMQEEFACRPEHCSVTVIVDGPWLCSDRTDCAPIVVSYDGRTFNLTGCDHEPERPPNVKTCQYK